MKNYSSLSPLVLLGILIAACALYLSLLDANRFGGYHDDAIYVTAAKALATGHGYRILSLPYEPAQTKYPPFYPLLLSLIWRQYPSFPDNIPIMMLFSVAATLAFLTLSWRYLVRYNYASKWQGLFVLGLTALNWRTAMMAVNVYSDMAYAAISVLTLYLAEKCGGPRANSIALAGTGALAGIAFLTRSSGIALLLAMGCYFGFRREWRKGLLVLAVGGIFVIGWIGWCSANRTTVEGVTVAYYTSYMGHFKEILADLQRFNHTSVSGGIAKIVATNFLGLILLSVPIVCSGMSYAWVTAGGAHWVVNIISSSFVLMLAIVGLVRQVVRTCRLLHLYVVCYLVIHLCWLPFAAYDRFLVPLLPFFLLFVAGEAARLGAVMQEEHGSSSTVLGRLGFMLVGLILICPVVVALLSYAEGLHSSAASRMRHATQAGEDAEAAAWIKAHTRPEDVIVCYRDPKYYLFTGRKTVRSFPVREGISWKDEGLGALSLPQLILRTISDTDGRYLVFTSSDFEYEKQPETQRREFTNFLLRNPRIFVPAFQSQNGRASIYRIEKTPG